MKKRFDLKYNSPLMNSELLVCDREYRWGGGWTPTSVDYIHFEVYT